MQQMLDIDFSSTQFVETVVAFPKKVALASTKVIVHVIRAGAIAAAVMVAPITSADAEPPNSKLVRTAKRARLPPRLQAGARRVDTLAEAPAETDIADPDYGF